MVNKLEQNDAASIMNFTHHSPTPVASELFRSFRVLLGQYDYMAFNGAPTPHYRHPN